MERNEWIEEIEKTAEICRQAGWKCEINNLMPTISIEKEGFEEEGYFFQDHEADNLLNDCPDDVSNEDYLLYIAQAW